MGPHKRGPLKSLKLRLLKKPWLPLLILANRLRQTRFSACPSGGEEEDEGKIIAVGVGLEGFMEWVDPNASDSAEEGEDVMSSLAVRFSTRMHKRATSAQGETTHDFELFGRKNLQRSGPNEEA